MDKMTGNRMRPLKSPKETVRVKTLKNVRNTWPVENEQRSSARKVVRPPLNTAGPMASTASTVRWCLVPAATR